MIAQGKPMAGLSGHKFPSVDVFLDDIRYSVRVLQRSPAFSMAVVLTLALGIGASTAVFSVLNSVLLRPLPYREPGRLVAVTYRVADPRFGSGVPSPPFLAWIEQTREFDALAAYNASDVTLLRAGGEQLRIPGAWISHNLLALLGAPAPVIGRDFSPQDDRPGGRPVAMLSHAFWWRGFGGTERILGQSLRINGREYEVIGVLADAFRFPGYTNPDVLIPMALPNGGSTVRSLNGVIGRLRHGSSQDRAEAELRQISKAAEEHYPAAMHQTIAAGATVHVVPLQRHIAGDLRGVLHIALGAVGFLLLLACANVGGLLLARMASRERELSVRAALGATPLRLARSLLAESVVLAGVGGGAALIALSWAMSGLRDLLARTAPHPDTIVIDRRVLAAAVLTTLLSALLCALLPVARGLRRDLIAGMKLASTGASRTTIRDSVRKCLIAGQMGIAIMLLIGALLLLTTLMRARSVALGFEPTNLLTMRVSAQGLGYNKVAILDDILAEVRTVPGVVSAGASTVFPLAGHSFGFSVSIAGEVAPLPETPPTSVDLVSPGYFQAMGVSVNAGREFTENDSRNAPPVAIVNGAFVRRNLRGRDPLGQRISLGGRPEDANITVVGVVDDVRDGNAGDHIDATVYRPFAQAAPQIGWHTAAVVIRTSSDPRALSQPTRRIVAAIAPGTAVYDIATMEDRLAVSVAPERQRAVLFGVFALAAVVLTGVGLYGLVAYSVRQDMHEFGVRLALGSNRLQLLSLVMRRGIGPSALGVALGLAGALVLSRALSALLYGVTATDLATFVVAAIAMLSVSVLASVLAARGAMNADPLTVLRAE